MIQCGVRIAILRSGVPKPSEICMSEEQLQRFSDFIMGDDLDFYEEYTVNLAKEERRRFFRDNPDFMMEDGREYGVEQVFVLFPEFVQSLYILRIGIRGLNQIGIKIDMYRQEHRFSPATPVFRRFDVWYAAYIPVPFPAFPGPWGCPQSRYRNSRCRFAVFVSRPFLMPE